MRKKGVSPVIATVLLVGIVLVSALIVFVWVRGFTEEAVTKFGGENIELTCEKVNFEASYSEDSLSITNVGNVPMYSLDIKISGDGSYITRSIEEITGSDEWPEVGLKQGQSFSGSIGSGDIEISSGDELILIPVLLGKTSDGEERVHTCEEQHGKLIEV